MLILKRKLQATADMIEELVRSILHYKIFKLFFTLEYTIKFHLYDIRCYNDDKVLVPAEVNNRGMLLRGGRLKTWINMALVYK